MAVTKKHQDFLESYRERCLSAYHSTPDQINADYSDEGQIQSDYHKRFTFELIQNADDAMQGVDNKKKVKFKLVDRDTLLVANTGRPINKDDVTSLCVMSSTTKNADGDERASIGHKGRGFSSVLEITNRPQVYSTGITFEFNRAKSRREIEELVNQIDGESIDGISSNDDIDGIPLMRLPFSPEKEPKEVAELLQEGYNTVFRFELENEKVVQDVRDTLQELDKNTILFLQELEELEVDVDGMTESWTLKREGRELKNGDTELTYVTVEHHEERDTVEETFALFSRDKVKIGSNKGGIDENTWGEVNYTQVGLALRVLEKEDGDHLVRVDHMEDVSVDDVESADWPHVHVFLPTEEVSPVPVLMNGAFHTAISRTHIKVTSDNNNYNGFILEELANLLATDVIKHAESTATKPEEILDYLNFTELPEEAVDDHGSLEGRFVGALKEEISDVDFIPQLEKLASGEMINDPGMKSVQDIVVPYYTENSPEISEGIARIYGRDKVSIDEIDVEGWFPKTTLLTSERASVLEGLGAGSLKPQEIPFVLGSVEDENSELISPESPKELTTDPILEVLILIWESIRDQDEIVPEFKQAANESEVFPVGQDKNGVVKHVANSDDTDFFIPPRTEITEIDLSGIEFLTPPLYRPEESVDPATQSELVDSLKPALESIWDVSEFDFEEVIRSAVSPKLPSPQNPGADLSELRDKNVLNLIQELGQESIDPENPLPYIERDGTLHRLCLIPVPTKSGDWELAYKVYFGEEWQKDIDKEGRAETLLREMGIEDASVLASPETILDGLEQPKSGGTETSESEEDTGNQDEEESEFDRWKEFFNWLGVSEHMRLTPLFSPEQERNFKQTQTKDGVTRPETGSLLSRLNDRLWDEYQKHLNDSLDGSGRERREYDSIYQLHGIEYLDEIVEATDGDGTKAELLFEHIAAWWQEDLQSFRHPVLATHGVSSFGRRNRSRPKEREKRRVGTNLWIWQLRELPWCPTTQVETETTTSPVDAWMPSESIKTKFSIEDYTLLPVLADEVVETAKEVPGLLDALDIRKNISEEYFYPEDAENVTRRLSQIYSNEDEENISNSLRQIKPVYRYLSEVLPALGRGSSRNIPDEWADKSERLAEVKVLTTEFNFVRAGDVFFVRSPDVLERIPIPADREIFVLQEEEAVRFGEYFGLSDLEDKVETTPTPIDNNEDRNEERTQQVREHLTTAAPYILCRLESDRPSQEMIDQDTQRLSNFRDNLTVVDRIEVDHEFDEEDGSNPEIDSEDISQEYFIESGRGEEPSVFLSMINSKNEEELNQILARALCEYLEVSQFEGVFSLLDASGEDQMKHRLRLAGAPSTTPEITGKQKEFENEDWERNNEGEVEPLGELGGEEENTQKESVYPDSGVEDEIEERKNREKKTHSVYSPSELEIDGKGIVIEKGPSDDGETEGDPKRERGTSPTTQDGPSTGVSAEYVNTVDDLGMSITMSREEQRLSRLDDVNCSNPGDYVFDVSDDDKINSARDESDLADKVIDSLNEEKGLPLPYPGFDILTIHPGTEQADRLIELKSSGHDTRTPEVTWNEWKTASKEEVSEIYYLYIVGNLRKDVSSEPYIKEIPNPFDILRSEVQEEKKTTKKLKVRVDKFQQEVGIRKMPLSVLE